MKNKQLLINRLIGLVLTALLITAISCNNNETENPVEVIAGSGSKTWKIDQERDASGDKQKLTKAEKKETITFYTNGTFSINTATMQEGGNWTYDEAAKRLSMQFQGETVSENFAVKELDKNEIYLEAADGSTMELKTE
ncbi:MAG: hypothetical protein LPJ89_07330 [Hymenobacteraceae bacterium]|nr:hypothetical protein [Hymenobacteraceae bacterium]MDX5395612.1 hypothetical protein [Hymenobacteraceae bacterium]MDX5443577.1 hypothetical protein [Hymenobacteraceae bacterium]MDX5511666.1 hypothetical protein [Hymenobacteraceae bacterium]